MCKNFKSNKLTITPIKQQLSDFLSSPPQYVNEFIDFPHHGFRNVGDLGITSPAPPTFELKL